jgi:hypothetical protein
MTNDAIQLFDLTFFSSGRYANSWRKRERASSRVSGSTVNTKLREMTCEHHRGQNALFQIGLDSLNIQGSCNPTQPLWLQVNQLLCTRNLVGGLEGLLSTAIEL